MNWKLAENGEQSKKKWYCHEGCEQQSPSGICIGTGAFQIIHKLVKLGVGNEVAKFGIKLFEVVKPKTDCNQFQKTFSKLGEWPLNLSKCKVIHIEAKSSSLIDILMGSEWVLTNPERGLVVIMDSPMKCQLSLRLL